MLRMKLEQEEHEDRMRRRRLQEIEEEANLRKLRI